MKIRFDFVTNSSSSSFIVRVGVRLNNGEEIKYEAFSEDDGGGVDCGEVIVDGKLFAKAENSNSADELFELLENAVIYSVLDWDTDQKIDKKFDPQDFELYKGIRKKSYTKDDYLEAEFGDTSSDDISDGRSVPFSKGIVIFDKQIRKIVKDIDDIQSIIIEKEHTASGEYIQSRDFPGLDWSESGMSAKCISVSEMDLNTLKIKTETSSEWEW